MGECKLPLGAGSITLKALSFPISAGKTAIPVDVKVSSIIPASLASVDVRTTATDATAGDELFCLDVHTEKQMEVQQQAGSLAVTWSDCGGRVTVTDLEPASIETGSTTTLTGEGQLDKDCAGASFDATVSSKGVKLTSCSGDASKDVECKLPLGAGSITLKALSFPISAGKTDIPVEVKTEKQALSAGDRPDCSQAACQANCECSYVKCSDQVDACLAAPNCASSQDCAFACPCVDGSCLLKCAASSPSIKALPLAKCITSNCDASVMV